jgi:hypothetical protein
MKKVSEILADYLDGPNQDYYRGGYRRSQYVFRVASCRIPQNSLLYKERNG